MWQALRGTARLAGGAASRSTTGKDGGALAGVEGLSVARTSCCTGVALGAPKMISWAAFAAVPLLPAVGGQCKCCECRACAVARVKGMPWCLVLQVGGYNFGGRPCTRCCFLVG